MDKMDDKPRFLTNDEIESILARLAPPQIMMTELRNHVHTEIKKMYKYQLEILKLKPSKIDKLGDYIANKSERSFFHPGTPVGFNIAESVSQPATQLVLNTFHSAGQVGQSPFKRFERNIKLSQYKKKPGDFNMKIHMYNKDYSYEDLYIKAQQFVTVTLDSLLDNSMIVKEEYPFDDMSIYTEDFKTLNKYTDDGYAIRLRFDNEKLFLHQIPLESIAMELEKIDSGRLFTVFYGPQREGIIDIYPSKIALLPNGETDENSFKDACQVFESGTLMSKIQNIRLGDYSDISTATVEKIPVVKLIQDVTWHFDITDDGPVESKTHARVWVNWVFAKKEGVPIEKLEKLLELTGYPIVETDPDGNFYVVESNSLKIKSSIEQLLKQEDKALIEKFSETKLLSSSELYLAGYYNFIHTQGSNLAMVRVHPEVDEFTTISNSALEIFDVLGLEACRSYLEKEMFDLFADNGQNIAPRNISMLVDWMTASFRPISVNIKSMLKTDSSIIRSMCFEDPKENVVKGAVLSTEDPISNVSSRILFGVKQKIGTGSFSTMEDREVMELYSKLNSETNAGAFRLTAETLASSAYSIRERKQIPQAESDLFSESDLSRGSEIDFQV